MTAADLATAAPLLILGLGSVAVLLAGAFGGGRGCYALASLFAAATALWGMVAPTAAECTLGLADSPFSRFFTVLFSLAALATLLLSAEHNRRRGIHGEEYPATLLFAAFGMVTVAMSRNLLLLFLGLESLTFAFYILTAIDREREVSGEAGLKYLMMGASAAAFNAFGIAFLYAASGTLEMGEALRGGYALNPGLFLAGWGFLLAGLGFKVSLVPFHLWTPDVYQGAPSPVAGFLSTGSKAATFAALLLLLAATGADFLRFPLWWLSLLSMLLGNTAALLQRDLKRMLAYSSIGQMGYVTLALLTGTPEGYEAVAFYAAAYTAMNIAAFGSLASLSGEKAPEEIEALRGFGYRHPFRGAVLALSMLALAGIPPTAGFTGKFAIFLAALQGGEAPLAIVGILTAAVSVFFYLRVVVNLYMREGEGEAYTAPPLTIPEGAALALGAAGIVIPGIFPGPLFDLVQKMLR